MVRPKAARANVGSPHGRRPSLPEADPASRDTDELALYRLIFSVMKDYAIFALDPDGRVVTWNGGAERIKGYRAEEIIGRSFACLYADEDVRRGIPRRHLEHAAANGRFADHGWRRRKDGSLFWAAIAITALRDPDGRLLGYAKITRDLTDPNAVDFFRAVVDMSADAILVIDPQGRIALTNQQTERVLGYRPAELVGQDVEMLVPARVRARHRQHRADFAAGPRPRPMGAGLGLCAVHKDGSEVPVEISLGPLPSVDGVLVSAVLRDVSDRKRLEAEVEANRLRMIASARLAALGTMASGIAHEINNPLAVIHAVASDLTEMAERGEAAAQQVMGCTRRIEQYADRIARIVTSLRHLARDGSKDPVAEAPARDIVEDALDLCRERFYQHGLHLLVAPIDPDIRVPCRQVQISQVLVNLLQNAFDAVLEQAGERWVRVEVAVHPSVVVFSVIDSGNGVPPDLKARIMDPFFTTKPVGKGTGLGLSLSKQIAEEHGGSLELGEIGGHTCFSLALPLPQHGAVPCN